MAYVLGLDPTVSLVVGAILVVLGLVMAFFGRGVWQVLMALIGAILGAVLGYLIGFLIGGNLIGIILGFVGGLLGGVLFGKLVKIGLALVMGILAAALVYAAAVTLGDARLIVAIVAFFVVFALSYYFIDELIGIITAIIGGLLAALGVYILLGTGTGLIAGGAGVVLFIIGAAYQTMKIRRKKKIAAAMAAPQAAYPPPPQSPPPQT